jgi:hypothetical protein
MVGTRGAYCATVSTLRIWTACAPEFRNIDSEKCCSVIFHIPLSSILITIFPKPPFDLYPECLPASQALRGTTSLARHHKPLSAPQAFLGTMSESSKSIGWRLQIFTAFFVPLQIVAVILRFYSRRLVLGAHFVLEDSLVLIALVFQLALSAVGVGESVQCSRQHESTDRQPSSQCS